MKNIVFMPLIKLNDRSNPYHYSYKSWKKWCDKNNCHLFVLEDLIHEIDYMKITWQRYHLFDILDANEIDYDQVLMIDADTIVHPDCPNFFEMTDNKYVGVHNNGSYDWVCRSIENYSKHIFNGKMIDCWSYINGGFQIVNKNHKDFFKKVLNFYFQNRDNLVTMQNTFFVGSDQTPINFLLDINEISCKLLPYEFNMVDMSRKEILDEQLTMTKVGWIYHYNAIPNNNNGVLTNYWMEKTYKYLYGE